MRIFDLPNTMKRAGKKGKKMQNVIEILKQKFESQVKGFGITKASVLNNDLCLVSTYEVSTDTYKIMISFLNKNGINCEF